MLIKKQIMLDRFLTYNTENKLFTNKHKILLAVSGGIDSMVMMHLFYEAKFDIHLAHCNFKLRNIESDKDEIFVLKAADKFKLRSHIKSFETIRYSKNNKISVQMAARELRYNWFNELAEKHNYDRIAIAHNRDDLVETFLINLSRGTGIKGLTGMNAKQNKIVRPLLFASRKEIEEYVKINNVEYREDSSNKDTKYQRNLIRHKIIPLFEKLNPSFKETIFRETNVLRSTAKVYEQELQNILKAITVHRKPSHVLSIQKILSLRLGPEILYDLLSIYGYSYSTVQDICSSLDGEPGKLFYSDKYTLLKDRKTLVIEKIKRSDKKESFEIKEGAIRIEHPLHLSFSAETRNKDFNIPGGKTSISLDLDMVCYPLELRKWKKGDYFYPLGMKNKKKLSDFFTDRKINRLDKDKVWVLTSKNEIVWIVGHQIDERYKVRPDTVNLLHISLNE